MSFMQCVKCAVNFSYGVVKVKSYPLSEETEPFLQAIRQWTGQDLLKEAHLCATCWQVATQYVIEGKPLTPEIRSGNHIFCIACGKSTLRTKKRLIKRPDNTNVDEKIVLILQKLVEPRKITLYDEVCKSCWMKADRAAKRYLPTSETQFELAVLEDASVQNNCTAEVKEELIEEDELNHENPKQEQFKVEHKPMEVAEEVEKECESTILSIPPTIETDEKELYSKIPVAIPIVHSTKYGKKIIKWQTDSVKDKKDPTYFPTVSVNKETDFIDPQRNYIMLPNIRRASVTANSCIFDKCKAQERCLISAAVRQRILQDYNFFIPMSSRICSYHLKKRTFHELYAGTNTHSNFNAQQIEQMIFTASQTSSVNLRTPDSIQSDLFEYILGFTPTEYNQIIEHFPQLNNQRIKFGLNALLCKLRTGDSNTQLSKFFKISRTRLQAYMSDVKKILKDVNFESYVKANFVEKTIELDKNSGLLKDKSCCNTKWLNTFMALIKAVNDSK